SQSAAGSPWFALAVNEVRPNAAVDITVPESVQQAVRPYARVTNQKVADGVWYLTGGSHHSVAIEMKDHVIVVEAPLNDDRAMGVMNDGTRTVEIHHVVGNNHEDGMLMVYLPKEKLLIQADMFTPAPPNAPAPAAVNPNTVNLADNIARLGLAVEQHLPLHGRIVPMAELNKAIGRAQ